VAEIWGKPRFALNEEEEEEEEGESEKCEERQAKEGFVNFTVEQRRASEFEVFPDDVGQVWSSEGDCGCVARGDGGRERKRGRERNMGAPRQNSSPKIDDSAGQKGDQQVGKVLGGLEMAKYRYQRDKCCLNGLSFRVSVTDRVSTWENRSLSSSFFKVYH
jgi:hypothetical protein